MTDSRQEQPRAEGRLNLEALAPTAAQADRVMVSVMNRVRHEDESRIEQADILAIVGEPRFALLAAAAAAVITVGSILGLTRHVESTAPPNPVETVATWAAQQHVPTNAELLMTFQGYRR